MLDVFWEVGIKGTKQFLCPHPLHSKLITNCLMDYFRAPTESAIPSPSHWGSFERCPALGVSDADLSFHSPHVCPYHILVPTHRLCPGGAHHRQL